MWPTGSMAGSGSRCADGQVGQHALAVVEVGVGVVGALDVDPQVAGERDRAARRRPLRGRRARDRHVGRRGRGDGRLDAHRHGLADGVGHLRGDRPLPDEVVEAQVGAPQLGGELVGGAPPLAGGPDGLVRLLGVLDLAAVGAGPVGQVAVAVQLAHLGAGRGQRLSRQRHRVGPHVGDVAPLVEALSAAHDLRRGQPELAPSLLLEGRRDERWLRRAAVRLLVDRRHGERGAVEGR